MKCINYVRLALLCAGFFGLAVLRPALADWILLPEESRLSFISIKKGDVAEVHQFKKLQGTLNAAGLATVEILLDSLETNIPIRNERMLDLLFETCEFAKATISAKIDLNELNSIGANIEQLQSKRFTLEAELNLHGKTQPLKIKVLVVRLADRRLLVMSDEPVIINAADFALAEGIEKLRELAQLPAISQAVPVSFILFFSEK